MVMMAQEWTLGDLRWHWGSAYRIEYRRGEWRAARLDGKRTLTAATAVELLKAIRADYWREPVPRDVR